MHGAFAGTAWGASALSPAHAQCSRLRRRLAEAVDSANRKGGRYVLGIRVGSGEKRIERLRSKAADACAQAAQQDPAAAFEAAYAQGAAMVPAPAAPPELSSSVLYLTVGSIVVLVGIGAVALALRGGSTSEAPVREGRRYAS